MKTAVCVLVKNEERDIAEWLAYQTVIGFDTVVVLDNGSTDRTRELVRAASGIQDIRLLDWMPSDAEMQRRAYEHALTKFGSEFDWMAFLDSDEFLALPEGGSVEGLLRPLAAAAGVGVNWAIYGSDGHVGYPDGLVISNFRHRAPEGFAPNRHVKSFVRPAFTRHFVNAHSFAVDSHYVDPAGRPIEWEFLGLTKASPDYGVAQINHYFVRSRAHWNAKLRRGNPAGARPDSEFGIYDRNDVLDNRAARLADQVLAQVARYRMAA